MYRGADRAARARAASRPRARPCPRAPCGATAIAPTDVLWYPLVIRCRFRWDRTVNFHGGPIECLQVRLAAHAHIAGELGLRHLDDILHTGVTVRRKAPHDGTAEQHALGAKSERLQDVRAAPERSVHEH